MTRSKRSWPTTVQEAVDQLLATLTEEDKATLRALRERELIRCHFALGLYIRNEFGMWAGNKALLRACAQEDIKATGAHGLEATATEAAYIAFPDMASSVITKALWRRLQDAEPPGGEQQAP